MPAPTWNGKNEFRDGSYSVSDVGSTNSKITKDENGENDPHLDITEIALVHCNVVNNDYQCH